MLYDVLFFDVCFFKQKTAYEMRISDWSSDVCSSDLMGSIAVFRGAVGTDTVAYELISAAVRDGGIEASSIERAFSALLAGLQFFSANDAVVIRLIAVLDVALLMLYIARSTENERYFLLAVFLPAFFYSYTMNALRIGLASFLFMLFCQSFARRKSVNASNGTLGLSSVFMHYTACLFPLYFVAGFHRRIQVTPVVRLCGLISNGRMSGR